MQYRATARACRFPVGLNRAMQLLNAARSALARSLESSPCKCPFHGICKEKTGGAALVETLLRRWAQGFASTSHSSTVMSTF